VSKLVLELKVPSDYNKADFTQIIRAICQQVNTLSEGRIEARYQAQMSAPSSVAAAVGDIIWDANCTVRSSVAPGVAASYIRVGWICNVESDTNASFEEMRVLTGS
jgi:hypothetical protein